MNTKQTIIDTALSQSTPFSTASIVSLSGASMASVNNTLSMLVEQGKIIANREGKKYIYSIIDGVNNTQTTIVQAPIVTMEEKFKYIGNLVDMVIKGIQPSVMITGQSGIGKSYIVNERLNAAGLVQNRDYLKISGHSSSFGLYKLLYDNRDSIIIFDDCDNILLNSVCGNILKAALDSYDSRVVSWYSNTVDNQDLQSSFIFTGRIIFISNLFIDKIEPAVKDRAFYFDLKMTNSEISEHLQNIIEYLEPSISIEIKQEALDYIKYIQDKFEHYSIRTLIQAARICQYCKIENKEWKQMVDLLTRRKY